MPNELLNRVRAIDDPYTICYEGRNRSMKITRRSRLVVGVKRGKNNQQNFELWYWSTQRTIYVNSQHLKKSRTETSHQ